MRNTLFRGFHPDENGKEQVLVNGEWIKGFWVYGYYYHTRKTTYCFKEDYDANPDNNEYYILYDEISDWGLPNHKRMANVIPETVGQFTELSDMENRRIFENDIIREGCNGLYAEVFYNKERGCYALKGLGESYSAEDARIEWEVVGNIFSNPKILKT